MKLTDSLVGLPGVGPSRLSALGKLGLETAGDLLRLRPRRYLDLRTPVPLSQAAPGQLVLVRGRIERISTTRSPQRRMFVTTAQITDGSSQMAVTWFNQPYLSKQLSPDRELLLQGRVTVESGHRQLRPTMTLPASAASEYPLWPLYPTSRGVTSRLLQQLVRPLLPLTDQLTDPLPEVFRTQFSLLPRPQALRQLHQPRSDAEATAAKRRLAFDELLLFALQSQLARRAWQSQAAWPLPLEPAWQTELLEQFGYVLTADQINAAAVIAADLAKFHPMHRLLNGDVGSGKTVVAALACLAAAKNGYQTAFLAPTQILAEQHFNTLSALLGPLGLSVALETGQKKSDLTAVDLAIGTHALFSPKTVFRNIALVVVDEQHRFGVRQRQALREKTAGDRMPHLLSLSATPIPRTLALLYAGELDASELHDKPAGRRPVKTRLVREPERGKAYDFLEAHLKAGFQAYVVVPLIEETADESEESGQLFSLKAERASVEAELKRLQLRFGQFHLAALHGKMKPKDKQATMAKFTSGQTQILVATTVVEVGVDVPGATIILIEDADRFGLAQLHQLRGRVGRSDKQSFCFLFTKNDQPTVVARLRQFEAETDGFKLAEQDLATRGPGELFGLMQHGHIELGLLEDADNRLIDDARAVAESILASDPELAEHVGLAAELAAREQHVHLE